jgi:hypothetical protein
LTWILKKRNKKKIWNRKKKQTYASFLIDREQHRYRNPSQWRDEKNLKNQIFHFY